MRKIKRIILFSVFFLVTINVLDLYINRINSVSDISKHDVVSIYDKDGIEIYSEKNLNNASYVSIDKINQLTKDVFIQIEDKRFYNHGGIDVFTTVKAFFHNLTNDHLIGGSTITQQYAKNLYLSNEQTYMRKIKELYYAIQLENLYSKDQILEGYLNTIYFSNGIYGINDASLYYFNKSPLELTLKESTTLLSIIKSPAKYCPIKNLENNQNRTNILLNSLLEDDIITKKDYDNAKAEKIIITKTPTYKYPSSVLYFKDCVLNSFDKITNETNIYTNFDSELNLYIDSLIEDLNTDVAVVVLDKKGYIVSLVGNKSYSKSSYNIAQHGSRMIGSTVKPLLYYEALSYGMDATNTFVSEKKDFIVDDEVISVSNFNNIYDNTAISMAYALATSDNVYAMKTHYFIGTEKLANRLHSFNIETKDKNLLALGTSTTSLLKLCEIYNTFLNLGSYTPSKSHTHSVKNNIQTNNISLKNNLLDPNKTFIINDLLRNTFDKQMSAANSVTGSSISNLLNKEVAAKSGLTDFDSYMIGYTSDYTVGVWVGHSNNDELTLLSDKRVPKDLFYKIINFLPDKSDSIFTNVLPGITKKNEVILPHHSYKKDLFFI